MSWQGSGFSREYDGEISVGGEDGRGTGVWRGLRTIGDYTKGREDTCENCHRVTDVFQVSGVDTVSSGSPTLGLDDKSGKEGRWGYLSDKVDVSC